MPPRPQKKQDEGESREDVNFLLSSIRARENGLIFFLELFFAGSQQCLKPEEYRIYKGQFLQKQKIYTGQVRQLLEKYSSSPISLGNLTRSFWIKLKSILRVSMERARSIGLLHQDLQARYQSIIQCIAEAHETNAGIKEYARIESLIKKRTIEALVATKNNCGNSPPDPPSPPAEGKQIRSETFLKISHKPAESISYSPTKKFVLQGDGIGESIEVSGVGGKPKSMPRIRRKGEKSKPKNTLADFKKIQSHVVKYEKCWASVIEGRSWLELDRKKTRSENQTALFEALFNKNIGNHKTILKYFHANTDRYKEFVHSLKKGRPRRRVNLSQKKLNKHARDDVSESIVVKKALQPEGGTEKLLRPKTSQKQNRLNASGARKGEKILLC